MAMETQDIIKRSATNPITPAPRARDYKAEVAKLIDVSSCVGCKACQVACSEWNDIRDDVGHCVGVYDNPADLSAKSWTVMRFSETEQNGKLEWLIRKDGCMHCAEPGCLKACPSAGAIIQYANGIVDFQQENCIGCGYCIAGCPFNVPRLNKEDNRVYKCTLCVDRVSVGQEPACVKTCPTGAIHFGTKKEMLEVAEERVAKLKKRGYARAGIYNPQGVGGTHVMYVLHHADVALGTQTVAISLTPKGGAHTWLPAVWEGLAGTSRVARTQNPVSLDAAYPDRTYLVHVKVTDSPEVPVIYAGAITLR